MPLPVASLVLLAAASPLPAPKVDRYGDPLPAGAVARLGTVHLLRQHLPGRMRFAADGKTFHGAAAGPAWVEWDAATGNVLRRVRFPGIPGSCPWVSADGSVAVAEQPGGVHQVIDVRTNTVRFDLPRYAEFKHVADPFSADGRWLAGFDQPHDRKTPQHVRVWDTATGTERDFGGQDEVLAEVRFSPDGSRLVAHGFGGATCWDVATGERLWQRKPFALHDSPVRFLPDGKRLRIQRHLQHNGQDEVWDAATGQPADGVKPLPSHMWVIGYTPGGTAAFVGSQENGQRAIGVWDLDAERWLVRHPDHYSGVGGPFPDGKSFLTVYPRLQRWDLETLKPHYPDMGDRGHLGPITQVAYSPDGRSVYTLSPREGPVPRGVSTLRVWDPAGGRLVRTIDVGGMVGGEAERMSVAAAGRHVVLDAEGRGNGIRTVTVVDAEAGKLVRTLPFPQRPFRNPPDATGTPVAVRDGRVRTLVGYTDWIKEPRRPPLADGRIDVHEWDPATGQSVRVVRTNLKRREWGCPAALSPDGRRATDGKLVCDADTGRGDVKLAAPGLFHGDGGVFSGDGRFVAAWVYAAELPYSGPQPTAQGVWVWDALTGKPVAKVPVGGEIMRLSPDGRFLVTANATGISAWDLVTGKQVVHHPADPAAGYAEGTGHTYSLAVAPDGRTAVTGRGDQTCLIWDFSAAYKQAATPPPSAADLAAVWAGWAKPDANPLAGLWRLADHPGRSVPFLRAKVQELVKPTAGPSAADIAKAVGELDAPDFKTREAAERRLVEYRDPARPAITAALPKASPEARARLGRVLGRLDADPVPPLWAEDVPLAWAVAVLERVNTPDARTVVEQIAVGPPASRLTREAKAALDRMRR